MFIFSALPLIFAFFLLKFFKHDKDRTHSLIELVMAGRHATDDERSQAETDFF